MYHLEYDDNPNYFAQGETLRDLMEILASRVNSRMAYAPYIKALSPNAFANDPDFDKATVAVEINEESLCTFAAQLWDTATQRVTLAHNITPLSNGQFAATMGYMGLTTTEFARELKEPAHRVVDWANSKALVPVRIVDKVRELIDDFDATVKIIRNTYQETGVVTYPQHSHHQLLSIPLGWERRAVEKAVSEYGVVASSFESHSKRIVSDPRL